MRTLVFSSSATVYGEPKCVPIPETADRSVTNPYGRIKLVLEDVLADLVVSNDQWSISVLRYFNPIGAHPSGAIGEDPKGVPNNLLPFVAQVATGAREEVSVYGGDYSTRDGTGVRDYIHVVDLAKGHIRALNYLDHRSGFSVFNLGTGRGYSVMEVINAYERASGRSIPFKIVDRRPGDIAECFADAGKAEQELGWVA